MARKNWLTGVQRRLAEPIADDRNWLIELQVQIGVQDMAASAARLADEERATLDR